MSIGDIASGRVASPVKQSAEQRCPECSGSLLDSDGEIYCGECGLVTGTDRLDRGPEWRRFDDERENRERTGAPLTPLRHDRGLSSEIGWGFVSSGRKRRQLSRLRREHNRARFDSKADRQLAEALSEVARLASALELPRTACERSAVIYREAREEGLLSGRSIEALAAASVYAACRCSGLVRSIEEVSSVARCATKPVKRTYRVLNRELGLEAPVSRPGAYVPKVASAVEAPDAVRRRAGELVGLVESAGYATGRHPGGIAAACLYFAGHEHGWFCTQAALAEGCGVTTATIRGRLNELKQLV